MPAHHASAKPNDSPITAGSLLAAASSISSSKKYVVSGFSRTIHKSPPEGGYYVRFGGSGYSRPGMRLAKGDGGMKKAVLVVLGVAALLVPLAIKTAAQQSGKPATYITKAEVDAVNATPGVDRTIRVVDIGHEHYSVG